MTTKASTPPAAKTAAAKTADTNPSTSGDASSETKGASSSLEASGAIIEDAAKDAVDLSHPAVDSEPRAGVPEHSNSIQFNDPGLSQREAVMRQLKGED